METREKVTVQGISCAYTKAGDGPVVILLHGWAQSALTWKDIAPELSRDYTVYTLDLPGFGESDMPPSAWTIDDYAAFVHEFCSAFSLAPHAVIGHSFGSRVAFSYAAKHPPQKIVLASMGEWSGTSWFRTLNGLLVKTVGYAMPGLLFYMHKTVLTPQGYADTRRVSYEHGKRMLEVYLRTHAKETSPLPSVSVPTLLVYGKNDPITSAAIGSRMQELLPQSNLAVIDGAKHLVQIDARDEFVRIVKDFLRS